MKTPLLLLVWLLPALGFAQGYTIAWHQIGGNVTSTVASTGTGFGGGDASTVTSTGTGFGGNGTTTSTASTGTGTMGCPATAPARFAPKSCSWLRPTSSI